MKPNLKTDDEDREVVRDRGVVKVPMILMDSVQKQIVASQVEELMTLPVEEREKRIAALVMQKVDQTLHAPGSLPVSDAQAQVAQRLYDQHDRKLSDAWRNPPPVVIDAKPSSPHGQSLQSLYAARDRRLADAWRHA